MSPLILGLGCQVVEILLGAVTKDASLSGLVGKLLAKLIPVLSRAAGETPEETAARRADAEAIFAAHSKPIG